MGIDALIVCADLQRAAFGSTDGKKDGLLLGEVLPAYLADELFPERGYPPSSRTGVLLAGDFYASRTATNRGGIGDVSSVWQAFYNHFAWVTGVLGNHDRFKPKSARWYYTQENRVHLLHLESIVLGGCRIAGMGGKIGEPLRWTAVEEEDFLLFLELLLSERPDILILHQAITDPRLKPKIIETLGQIACAQPPSLLIQGHAFFAQPLMEYSEGFQVLNACERILILLRAYPNFRPV